MKNQRDFLQMAFCILPWTLLLILAFFPPAFFLSSASAQEALSNEEIATLSRQEFQAKPAAQMIGFLAEKANAADINAMFQYGLRELGFYHGLPNGMNDKAMREAVAAFRTHRGLKGEVFTMSDLEEMGVRLNRFEPDRFGVPRAFWDLGAKVDNQLIISGSWTEKGIEPTPSEGGYFGVRDYSQITCNTKTKVCSERSLKIETPTGHIYELSLNASEWKIVKSSDEMISARNLADSCHSMTLMLDRQTRKALKAIEHVQEESCPNEEAHTKADAFELVSAVDYLISGWKADIDKRNAGLNPAYRALVEKLRESPAWPVFVGLSGYTQH